MEIYNAIVATAGLIVTLLMWRYMYQNDNSFEVKVFPDLQNPVQSFTLSGSVPTVIQIKIITQNIGRQGIVLTDVVVHESHEEKGSLTSRIDTVLPRTLQSDEFIPHIYKRSLVTAIPVDHGCWPGFSPNIKCVFALDSRGRRWEMKKEDIEKINIKINDIMKLTI